MAAILRYALYVAFYLFIGIGALAFTPNRLFAETRNAIAVHLYNAEDYVWSIALLGPLADAGDATAKNNLGVHIELGLGTHSDVRRAISLYEEAALGGVAAAFYNRGYFEEGAASQEMSLDPLRRWYIPAAERGDVYAQIELANYLRKKKKLKLRENEDRNEWRLKLLRSAADTGNVDALLKLAELLEWRGEKEVAFLLTEQAAQSGNAQALAKYKLELRLRDRDQEAFTVLMQAAQAGEAHAQADVAVAFLTGDRLPQDYGLAVEWFARAATAQDPIRRKPPPAEGAQLHAHWYTYSWASVLSAYMHGNLALGDMYAAGVGVQQDYQRAADYYRAGMEKGFCAACAVRLADLYLTGVIGAENLNDGRDWLKTAASLGDVDAKRRLAAMEASATLREPLQ
jgi:uncharacterized protein